MRSLIFGILFCVGLAGIVFVSSILVLRPELVESSESGPISPFLEGQKKVEEEIVELENLAKEKNVTHFLIMGNVPKEDDGFTRTGFGRFQIHEDGDGDGKFTEGLDPKVEGSRTALPEDYIFRYGYYRDRYPSHLKWFGVDPDGTFHFPPEMQSPVEIIIARKGIDGTARYQLGNPELKMWLWSYMH